MFVLDVILFVFYVGNEDETNPDYWTPGNHHLSNEGDTGEEIRMAKPRSSDTGSQEGDHKEKSAGSTSGACTQRKNHRRVAPELSHTYF